MRRTLHLVRTAVVLVALALLGVGVHFLHAFQVTRNSGVLLDQADQARKDADAAKKAGDQAKADESLGKAADYLSRYLGFHPTDADALARYGLAAEELAKTPAQKGRAFLVLEKALRLAPERADVRRRLAKLAVDIGRTLDAREHLTSLLDGPSPNDPELEFLLARCEEADAHFWEAQRAYGKAVEHDPRRVETYVRLASLLRLRGDQAPASEKKKPHYTDPRQVIDDMVKASGDPPTAEARLARARYLREAGLLDDAARDVAAAREMAPEDVEVLLASAQLKLEKDDLEGAREELKRGLQSHPQELRLLLQMAALELREGRTAAAADQLAAARQALGAAPSLDDLWAVANLLIDAGKADDARELLEKLRATGPSPAADYLDARLKLTAGECGAAAALLEGRRKELAASPELARQTDWLLGLCYERLGNPDQQLAAFHRAAEQDPSWLPARLGQASALLADGKFDEALDEYRRLAPRAAEARLWAVRLLILRNLRAPTDRRDWAEADALAKDAPEKGPMAADFRLVKADLLAAQGRLDDAWKALDADAAAEPKEPRYRILQAALADLPTEKWKTPMTAREVLNRAESESGDTVELRLARASRFARLDKVEAVKALCPLGENVEAFDAAGRARLLTGLGDACVRAGDVDGAARLYRRVKELSKDDIGVRLRLFDLSLQTKDEAALKEVVDEVRAAEGPDGALWRYGEAALLVLQARRGERAGLGDARALLAEAEKRRPAWPRPPLLEATVDELEGDADAAAAKCRQAIDLGDRRPEVVRRAAVLLASRRRYDEAARVLQQLGDAPPGGDVGRIAAEVSLLNRDPKQHTLGLIEAAAKAAEGSKDYHDFLWLGQVYEAAGEHARAVEAFGRARDIDRSAPEAWAALALCLAGAGDKEKAEAELEAAGKALPADKAPAVLAAGYEALGRRDKAEDYYAGLLKGKPEVADLRTAAAFYLRGGDLQKAVPLLQQIIDAPGRADPEPARWARRTLALALSASGDFQQSNQALKLLDQNLREEAARAPEDQRVRALVLATQPGGRRESIRTLEESFGRLRPTPDEEFLLARLYELEPNGWDRANEHFLALAGARGGANPSHLAYYVQALLRHKDVAAAAAWLRRLEALEPDSGRTLGAKARVLQAQGQGGEAARLVAEYARKAAADKKDTAVLADAASLLEELQQTDKAEELYREYVKVVADKDPEKDLVLAAFLARRDRLTEALDVVEAALARCKPEAATRTAVAALRVGRPAAEHFQRVERLLRDAIAKNPMATNLLVSLADLRDAQGRDDEAEKVYRDVLRANPRNPLALNNLAWLLAFRPGKEAEALELADRRIEITGPSPGVLDTRGVILLKLGRADDAAQAFADAAAQVPAALYYFHLAEAQGAGGKSAEADKASLKARELGLKETDIHPLEKGDYQKWLAGQKPK
jgi:tetratricopeptide (TPR) repeat protein